ncbi:MAG TPA: hypothetical protein VGD67_25685 [Pseudonocardiaceae bacterium]
MTAAVAVAGLGAWCDYETVDEYSDRTAAPPAAPGAGDTGSARDAADVSGTTDTPGAAAVPGVCVPDRAALDAFARQANFRVEEFATLSDGRRVVLSDDRGWSVGGGSVDDLWARMTVASVEADVLLVVLPDDAEETGEAHPWEWFAAALRSHGVDVTAESLRGLPYDVVLSPRLHARLSADA